MKLTRLVTIALFLGSVSAGALSAQTRPGSQPAEFPPASYMGKQYVDSAGCVFIRAGIDGAVTWVPRISRTRQGVCGFRPTFAGQVTEALPAQAPAASGVTQITLDAPAAPAAAPAPQARPARVATAQPRPQPQPRPQVVRQVAPPPAPLIVEKPAETRQVAQVAAPAAPVGCIGASPISTQYLRGEGVRCGPQAMPIVGARISSAAAPRDGIAVGQAASRAVPGNQPVRVSPNTRIVPRHVAVNRVNTTNVQVPAGYNPVWEDGRLNPRRAEQSLAGHSAMSLIWTSTVPRRLINQADGEDVTASVPLVYPFTDFERQQRELGQVSIVQRDGQTLKRIVRNTGRVLRPEPTQARVTTVQRAPVYSSRSAPQTAPKAGRSQPKAEVAAQGYVQVGSFADAAAAQRLAREVQQMGLPVRVGKFTREGATTRLVIAGPFGGAREVDRAVSRLRSAGHNAFAR